MAMLRLRPRPIKSCIQDKKLYTIDKNAILMVLMRERSVVPLFLAWP